MDRTEPLGVRVPPDLKTELVLLARAQDRSLASLVERILRRALAESQASACAGRRETGGLADRGIENG